MATVEDYYSQTSYESKFVKGKNSIPKYWAMRLADAQNAVDTDSYNKLSDARRKATEKGMNDWSEAELRSFLKANFSKHSDAFDGSTFKYNGYSYTYPDIETASQEELFDIAASLSFIKANGAKSWVTRSRDFDNFNTQIDAFNKHRTIVQKLIDGGGTVEQISSILAKENLNALEDFDAFIAEIDRQPLLSENTWFREKMESAGLTEWGGGTSETNTAAGGTGDSKSFSLGTQPPKPTIDVVKDTLDEAIVGTPRTDVTKTLKDEVTLNNVQGNEYDGQNLTIIRDPNNPENYSIVDADDPRIVYIDNIDQANLDPWLGRLTSDTPEEEWYDYTDPEGNQLDYVNGQYQYPDGTPFNEGGMGAKIDKAEDSAEKAKDVVDKAVQTTGQAIDTAAGIENAYLGGNVSPEAANALGWIKNPDGSFTDPSSPGTTYIIGDDGNLVDQADPTQAATTQGLINLDENDFAGQTETLINEFLYGAQVTPENAQEYGFSYNKDTKEYISPDGTVYTDVGGQLQDENGVPIERSLGFIDYQSDLEGAAEEYTKQMTGLRGQYEQTFDEYEGRLEPLLQKQQGITDALMDVAKDAGSTDYYNKLSNLYYEQSRDEVNRASRGAQESLNSMYANAGLDPSSPAYTAAMMDLQKKRSDDLVSSRRQAILDSYSLGNNMLQNRSSTLSNAQTGIGNSMNALGGLYDVKISGLEVDKDMISTIYQGKQNQANIGIQGLNTVAGQKQSIIDTNKETFFKELDLRTGLNQNTQNTATTAATTAGNAAQNATDEYWRGMGWLQGLIDNNVDMKLFGTALQTQFADDPEALNFLTPEQKQMLGIGT